MNPCSVKGCERRRVYRLYCRLHYSRNRIEGSPGPAEPKLYRGIPEVERFWKRVAVGAPAECWEWQATRTVTGYGMFSASDKTCQAHRYSYELHAGPIPDGLVVRHRCDNPPCVNPAHLELGTVADNNRDRDERGRHWSKLTAGDVAEIRRLAALGQPQSQIGARFGVRQQAISKIVTGIRWKQLED